MDGARVAKAMSALAQETRLEIFRLLVASEPDGVAAGEIARSLGVPHNTLSAHLAVLSNCGLATARRKSRNIIYRADLARFRELMLYLLKDCCAGKPEVCAPLLADLVPQCRQPTGLHHG